MKFIISATFAFFSLTIVAQKQIEVNSTIKDVTVFLKGAQVTRDANISLHAGTNYLLFNNLSSSINPNSIQIEGSSDISILSVNHIKKKFSEDEFTGELKQANDSLQDISFKLGLRAGLKTVYAEEQSMILANKSLKGNNTGVNIEDLMELSDFYRIRLKDIQYKLVELDVEISDLKKEENKQTTRVNKLKQNRQAGASKISLALSSKFVTSTTIRISYLVYNASWKPDYDIRATNIEQPIELVYRGNIKQNTGNVWSNVNLKLSTGNPTINGSLPSLNTWYVDMKTNQPIMVRGDRAEPRSKMNTSYAMEADSESLSGVEVTNQQAAVSTLFDISIPYTVPSDNKAYTVELQKNELSAEFNYYAVPKLDQNVYLLAQVTGWESLNLLSGNTNIYYRGTYVGRSFLDPSVAQDTLKLSMGADPDVVVLKENMNDYKKKKSFSSENKITYSFLITSKNNKSSDIKLMIEDQIPVSKNKSVEVELVNSSNASYDESTGKLKWNIKLKSGTSKNTKLNYTITYPKDQNIMFK
jgi:uncharacterized protein (TIGR02231 family)